MYDESRRMINNPKVSVVIPMYNCEKFVHGVLSMFSAQSFTDFEVICVIDGATDGTEAEVKKYCENDNRFRYVVRENGGAGAARNTGLDIAVGTYIIFADADDEYSVDYLKKLYDKAIEHDAEIVICRFTEKNSQLNMEFVDGFDDKYFQEDHVYSHSDIDNIFVSFNNRVTNKLFKTKFIKNNGIHFSETVIANDSFFCCASLSVADRIVVIYDLLLCYRSFISPGSLRHKRVRFQTQVLNVLRLLYQWLKAHSLWDIHGEDYMRRINQVLIFEGSHDVTPGFIAEFAHMLNEEEPWKSMTSEEILKYLKDSLFAETAVQKGNELLNYLSPELMGSDLQLSYLLDYYKNIIHTAQLLRLVSLERYGMDFDCNDSLSGS